MEAKDLNWVVIAVVQPQAHPVRVQPVLLPRCERDGRRGRSEGGQGAREGRERGRAGSEGGQGAREGRERGRAGRSKTGELTIDFTAGR